MSSMQRRKAVFLDRDGTLIQDGPFLADPVKIRFLPGVLSGLKKLKQKGFILVIITNQSGIGRGYYTEETFFEIQNNLQKTLVKNRSPICAVYFCPHPPDSNCNCRKPRAGLFHKAIAEHGINPVESYAIGDKLRDAEAAKGIGCKTIIVNGRNAGQRPSTGHFAPEENHDDPVIDHIASSFSGAVEWILRDWRKDFHPGRLKFKHTCRKP